MGIITTITGDPILLISTVLGALSVALLAYAYNNGKKLNPLTSKIRSKSPFKYAQSIKPSVREEADDQGDQIPDLAVAQLDNLLSHAVSHGREVERAKGKNSDTLYKMVKINLVLSGLALIGILFLIFG